MKLETFFENFDLLTDAPNAATKLRELVLQLAVRGKLVEQDPNDEPASALLQRIEEEFQELIHKKKIRKLKALPKISEDTSPFTAPQTWEWCCLGNIIRISSGDNLTSQKMAEDGEIPVFGGNGITGYHDDFNVEEPTLVIGRVGFYCGSVHITPNKAWITDNAFATYFSKLNLDLQFLYWLFKAVDLQQNNSATAQPVISGTKVYPIPICLPPLAEQKRIVGACDRILTLCDKIDQHQQQRHDKLVKMNEVAIAKLLTAQTSDDFDTHWQRLWQNFDLLYSIPTTIPKLRQAILQLAVQGKLVKQDPNEEPATVLLEKLSQERKRLIEQGEIKKVKSLSSISAEKKLFPIPQSWQWAYLQDIFLFITDGDHQPPPKAESGIPFLVIGNVREGKLNFEGSRFVPEEYLVSLDVVRTPQKDDILYTVVGSYGIPVIVDSNRPFCVQRHIAILKTFKFVNVQYLKYLLQSDLVFEQATACATGIAQKTVPLNGLRRIVVPFPPLAEQKRIVAKVDCLMALCDALEAKLTAARAQRETLMEAAARQVLAV